MKVFIYALTDPNSFEIRYIGKSNKLTRRYRKHLNDKSNPHKVRWIKSLKTKGLSPVMEVLDEVNESEWEFWEKHYISLYKSWGFKLVNSTEGGLGGNGFANKSHSKKTKKILRDKALNRTNSYVNLQSGFKNGRCKVNRKDVIDIRKLYSVDKLSANKIGEIYKMSHGAILKIVRFKRYADI